MKLNLTGIAATQNLLREVSKKIRAEGARKAVRAGAEVIRSAIEEAAPVLEAKSPGSNSLEPGELKGDIRIRMSSKGERQTAFIGPSSKTAYVANWIEYGWMHTPHTTVDKRGRKVSSSATTQIPAQPFIRPAFEASVGDAIALCQEEAINQVNAARGK